LTPNGRLEKQTSQIGSATSVFDPYATLSSLAKQSLAAISIDTKFVQVEPLLNKEALVENALSASTLGEVEQNTEGMRYLDLDQGCAR
jgi:hypothetical protein